MKIADFLVASLSFGRLSARPTWSPQDVVPTAKFARSLVQPDAVGWDHHSTLSKRGGGEVPIHHFDKAGTSAGHVGTQPEPVHPHDVGNGSNTPHSSSENASPSPKFTLGFHDDAATQEVARNEQHSKYWTTRVCERFPRRLCNPDQRAVIKMDKHAHGPPYAKVSLIPALDGDFHTFHVPPDKNYMKLEPLQKAPAPNAQQGITAKATKEENKQVRIARSALAAVGRPYK